MTTLLAVYNSDRCVGRCDEQCYMATSARCRCICGGRNHGAGLERAVGNVAAGAGLLAEDLRCFATMRDLPAGELIALDRLAIPDARVARHIAGMKLTQPELPFDVRDDVRRAAG